MGQTVNLLLFSFGGSNPSAPTNLNKCEELRCGNLAQVLSGLRSSTQTQDLARKRNIVSDFRGNSSVDRALAFQAGGRGFESRFPLQKIFVANVAQW